MQPNTETPATAQPPAVPGTGAAAQATTAPPSPEALIAYTVASIAQLEAVAARYRAEEAEHRAMAAAHVADPFLSESERRMLSESAELRAENAAGAVDHTARRIQVLLHDCPAAAMAEAPMAVIVTTVHRDRIVQSVRLVMGGTRTVARTWDRTSPHSWKSRDPEWTDSEERIGVELVEHMEALSLPDRVANMLPRPAAARASSKAKAVAND